MGFQFFIIRILWHNWDMTQKQALEILKTGANVFLTGEPGSGKTYTINQFVEYLRNHGIEPSITASTGIAATHIGGMTIHSWSGIGIKNHLTGGEIKNIAQSKHVLKRIVPTNVLIIDEVSMLAPYLLDMVDAICRQVKNNNLAFGGIQVVLVGDFFQLPPIFKNELQHMQQLFEEKPSRFAYDARSFRQAEFVTCYIDEQHRQSENELIKLLSKIRSNEFDEQSMATIEKRKITIDKISELTTRLYTHNIDVDAINDRMLAKIPQKEHVFTMLASGHEALIGVMKKGCLSPENLILKKGAWVMFTKNNQKMKYVNGTLGTVEGFNSKTNLPIVKTKDGLTIETDYAEWIVEEEGKVKGRLTQIPLRLAWAITVHKSQGISLDEAVIDLSRVFEFGQGYVALSRVRKLNGLNLLGWNSQAFQVDSEVLEKDLEFRRESQHAEKVYNEIPPKEIEIMQNDFIIRCGGGLKASRTKKSKNSPAKNTLDTTLDFFNAGLTVVQIARERNLSENTIFGHIEQLSLNSQIDRKKLINSAPERVLREFKKIQIVFGKLETDKLTPVYEHFDGKYSYEELKWVRLISSIIK